MSKRFSLMMGTAFAFFAGAALCASAAEDKKPDAK